MQQEQVLSAAKLVKLPPRAVDCHKGQLGHVLVVAGTQGMGGAGPLAAQAALRLGAGLATPKQQLQLCRRGHPVMAGAGFGDVLGGVIAAFIAQGLSLFNAGCLAVYLHAVAGEQLAGYGRGVAASDLLSPMRALLQELCPV